MRILSGSPDAALPVLHPLALILAALAPVVWAVAGLTFGLTLLVPAVLLVALAAPLGLVLAPLALAVLELAPLTEALRIALQGENRPWGTFSYSPRWACSRGPPPGCCTRDGSSRKSWAPCSLASSEQWSAA